MPRVGDVLTHSTDQRQTTANVPTAFTQAANSTVIELGHQPFDLRATLKPLQHGHFDPTMQVSASQAWRATRTPEGPGTIHLQHDENRILVSTSGPGAAWLTGNARELLGLDRPQPHLQLEVRALYDAQRRARGLRLCRSRAVFEAAIPSVIEQRVTSSEAVRSFRSLTLALSEPAPGPCGNNLYLPIDPATLAKAPAWSFHKYGIEAKRANVLRSIARHSRFLDAIADGDPAQYCEQLMKVPGIGAWTAAEISAPSLGDSDAVSVGDFHLKNFVCWNLAGEARGTDERMCELLEEFRPHRGWVVRLILQSGSRPPKFGPRYSPLPIAEM